MDSVRFGRGIRAIRQRRRWRQEDLAASAGCTRGVIWRIEHGRADRVTVARLDRVATALDARIVVRLDWRGEQLDRLIDGAHADVVEQVVRILRAAGWQVATEATFSVFGERGSIDVLAFHPATRMLLVIEVKTVVPDVGPMLMSLDRKVRLAPRLAAERGWRPAAVAGLLVVREGPTARRHVARLAETFGNAFSVRGLAVRRCLRLPAGPIAGLWFLSSATEPSVRKRIRRPDAQSGPQPPR